MQQEALDQETLESAMGRMNGILHGTQQEQFIREMTTVKPRKPRKDKGVPKGPKTDTDEIVLKLTLDEARGLAIAAATKDWLSGLAGKIQDQIIAQLQKRIDALTK